MHLSLDKCRARFNLWNSPSCEEREGSKNLKMKMDACSRIWTGQKFASSNPTGYIYIYFDFSLFSCSAQLGDACTNNIKRDIHSQL